MKMGALGRRKRNNMVVEAEMLHTVEPSVTA